MLDGVRIGSLFVEMMARWTDYIDFSGGYALNGNNDNEEEDGEKDEAFNAACLCSCQLGWRI